MSTYQQNSYLSNGGQYTGLIGPLDEYCNGIELPKPTKIDAFLLKWADILL